MKKNYGLFLLALALTGTIGGCGSEDSASGTCAGLFCDDFNRSSGPLGNGWTTDGITDGTAAYNPSEISVFGSAAVVNGRSTTMAASSGDGRACNTSDTIDGGATDNRYYGAYKLANISGADANNLRVRLKFRSDNTAGFRAYITTYGGDDVTASTAPNTDFAKIGCDNSNPGCKLEIDAPGVSAVEGSIHNLSVNQSYVLQADFSGGDITVTLYQPDGTTLIESVNAVGTHTPKWIGFVVGDYAGGVTCVDDYQVSSLN